jgi:hypothetical protein
VSGPYTPHARVGGSKSPVDDRSKLDFWFKSLDAYLQQKGVGMSETPITIRTRIEEIDVYEKDLAASMEGRAGHVDVRYWLERGEQNLGFATVRLFFARTDISLDELTASALAHGHQVLSQLAQHYKPSESGTSSGQLWKQ